MNQQQQQLQLVEHKQQFSQDTNASESLSFQDEELDEIEHKVKRFDDEYLKQVVSTASTNNTTTGIEMTPLDHQCRKLQKLLMVEQDKYTQLSKQLHDSEAQRLELISQNNKEVFALNTQFAKARNELEKSETMRQNLEYEMSVLKCGETRDKKHNLDKEKMMEEIQKNFEDQLSIMAKEVSQKSMKITALEIEVANQENDRNQLKALQAEQEEVIKAIKEESNLLKESYDKLKTDIEFYQEKAEQTSKSYDSAQERIQELETRLEEQTKLETQLAHSQKRNKDLESVVDSNEKKRQEIEINLEKLMDQLKENRKEISEEQNKSRELRERFKIIESHLNKSNEELKKKLEEKVGIIKNLSHQLNNHENNFKEIKNELNDTTRRQAELDTVYNNSMKSIDQIKSICHFDSDEPEHEQFKKFLKEQTKISKPPQSVVCPTLAYSLNTLKTAVDDYKKFFHQKLTELVETKQALDKSEHQHLLNSSKIQEVENLKVKFEKEMGTLREERVALEEVIVSLRTECETLRSSLNNEFTTNDNLKSQVSRLTKSSKESGEQKLVLLQSLYKRLLPVSVLNKKQKVRLPGDLRDEKSLESFLDKLVDELVEHLKAADDKVGGLEKAYAKRGEDLSALQKKSDDQVTRLTKIIKEKESHHTKQKESLVSYYEQLLNDVNSRVKQSQNSAGEAWDQLKESSYQLTKTLEAECLFLKNNQKNLTTSCLILIGILKPLINSNSELKEQRRFLSNIYTSWYKSQRSLEFNASAKSSQIDLFKNKSDRLELAEAVDYSLESSVLNSDDESEDTLNESSMRNKRSPKHKKHQQLKTKFSKKAGLFRCVVITVLAANRLRFFARQSKNTKLAVPDESNFDVVHKFVYSDVHSQKSFTDALAKTRRRSNDMKDEQARESLIKNLFCLTGDNSDLFRINEISNELNQMLAHDNSTTDSMPLKSLLDLTKESVLKCLSALETSTDNQDTNHKPHFLANCLKKGLIRMCNANPNMSSQYSFQKKVHNITQRLKQTELEKNTSMRSSQQDNDNSVHKSKFDAVCKELENSLGREEQAQAILNKQSIQLEDLSHKLAQHSVDGLQANKLKDLVADVTHRFSKKEKLAKQLQKKVQVLTVMKDNYENSASSILLDKKLFLNYCQNIEGIIENSLKISLYKQVLEPKEIIEIIRQISSVSFALDYEAMGENERNDWKLSPESLACQSIVNLFCITFNMLIVKLYSKENIGSIPANKPKELEEKVDSVKEDFSFDSSEKSNILVSSNYSETSINLGREYVDFSFQQLPLFDKQKPKLKSHKKQLQTAA